MKQKIVYFARSLFERGFVVGSAGNISIRLDDGTFLSTPTGSSFGTLKEEDISHFNSQGELLSGKEPTKEIFFHLACYEVHPEVNAVVHLHSTYSTLLASLINLKEGVPIKPFTPYFVMKIKKIGVLPYRKPGNKQIAEDIREKHEFTNFLMANHGLIVCNKSLEEAIYTAEEFEETAKLWFLGQNLPIRYLTEEEVSELY
jgi:ribulose-5-phosphate 4-epimerase/fuculose-1-phosphate aldolase